MADLWCGTMPYKMDEEDFIPEIKAYNAGSKGAVIVFPGGGYGFRAEYEGDEIGEWLQSNGVTAFVVEYRIAPYKHPAELADALRAVKTVRHYADEYGIDRDKIAVMGFSAGGHLAASVSVHYDKDIYEATDEIDNESARPDASILCYPVIDMGEYRHDGSRQNLLGRPVTEKIKDFMSLHKQVNENTPEAFIWHTSTDGTVPLQNSLMYADALTKENIPCEMHIYPMGPHGMGLAKDEPYVARWADNLLYWLKNKSWI